MIHIHDLTFTYKGADSPALNNICLDIEQGAFVGIIGESGAGKSTLAYTINGVIPHFYKGDFFGSSVVNGLDTFEVSLNDLSQFVGSIFQDIDGQMVASVVEDEILFGLENFGVPSEEIEERLQGALKDVGIESLRYRSIHSLSGGQKQKVALSAVLALRPKILVLDEPTGELDPRSTLQIFALLKKLNEDYGITIIIIEQKIMVLCEFVKSLIVMNRGTAVFHGPVKEVLKHSRELESLGVNCPRIITLSNRLSDLGFSCGDVCVTVSEAVDMIKKLNLSPMNSENNNLLSDIPETCSSSFITFDHVSFAYQKQQTTVNDVTFSIKRGEFAAIAGSNGAGKSTISKMFNGLLLPSSGNVIIDGQDTKSVRTSDLAKKIGFLFQNPDTQICQNTVRDEILFGLRCISKDEAFIQTRYDFVMSEFSFREDAEPFNLSRGERQMLALASIFAIQPEILVLDEPTTGLDYKECMHVMQMVKHLNEQGTTVIMVCHDMELVLDFARTVYVIHDGALLKKGSTREIFADHLLLKQASLAPPQIAQLSRLLGEGFQNVFTVDELIERIDFS